MPLILSLAAQGSHCRFLRCTTRLPDVSQPCLYISSSPASTRARLRFLAAAQIPPRAHLTIRRNHQKASNALPIPQSTHGYPTTYAPDDMLSEEQQEIFDDVVELDVPEVLADMIEEGEDGVDDGPTPSRRSLKRQRSSRPAFILESMSFVSRKMYFISDTERVDHSYFSPALKKHGGLRRRNHPSTATTSSGRSPAQGPMSLYTILGRQLSTLAESPDADITCTGREIAFLQRHGYSAEDVVDWVESLTNENSVPAAAVFSDNLRGAPWFLLLIYLRRKRVRKFALGLVLRHVKVRLEAEPIDWSQLQVLIIRLTRHARMVWPEALPWIASLFCTKASQVYEETIGKASYSSTFRPALTRFCNSLLTLTSLATLEHPILSGIYQEKAQIIILQFMASREPPLIVTRHGFSGAIRTMLTHSKTVQEKEWAKLKGPSWPPWKEDKTAMDEDKGYMFGASRASRLLHRLHDAGYESRSWEQIAEVYAGWDTDLSPAVQTRFSMPSLTGKNRLNKARLWAARIRTTRTRREAWACFLAYEESGNAPSSTVYQAMYEKLHYSEIAIGHSDPQNPGSATDDLLPGDMKEVIASPQSPLHQVYISEPVPSYVELYQRMWKNKLRPKKRLHAFLLTTLPDFATCEHLLKATQSKYAGGVRMLHQGLPLDTLAREGTPKFFISSFIHFLCRFGRIGHSLPRQYFHRRRKQDSQKQDSQQDYLETSAETSAEEQEHQESNYITVEEHEELFKADSTYLIDYAYTLLMRVKPRRRQAWTIFMEKVVYGFGKQSNPEKQYAAVCQLLDNLKEIDVDPDDAQFQILCDVARYTAQSAYQGKLSREFMVQVLPSIPTRLRTAFNNLVGANVETTRHYNMDAPEPHVPDGAVLHAYVRALGYLQDYEGLYSFSIWLTSYHKEVLARMKAQHGGPRQLYNVLIALRAGLEGSLDKNIGTSASPEIVELVRAQIEGADGWDWPSDEHMSIYVGGQQS